MNENVSPVIFQKKELFLRKIRSFVVRRRITKSQVSAINDFWPRFGIMFEKNFLNLEQVFFKNMPIVLEIGFGTGKSLVKTAIQNPDKNFLGIEVYESGIGNCLKYINKYNLNNIKIIFYDAVEVLNNMIKNETLSRVQIFFPDPWEKRRHRKRRMVTKHFSKVIHKKLTNNGIIYIVTDVETYAKDILYIFDDTSKYINLSDDQRYVRRLRNRPITKFEKKGISLGKVIFELIFRCIK
ncbi:tRNA (guanosine(46)-N7)-methyltransferase TrmB [Buchnera aphidicola]|uniref:tRNA (guanosine(46)-N7)-methyltransferase TrmB n=1 Tax=Buchnera aphidicola TaxID=9 RepID=UPI0031B82913